MQCLANNLIGNMGAVEIARINMIDAAIHGFPKYRDRFLAIFRRAEDAFTG